MTRHTAANAERGVAIAPDAFRVAVEAKDLDAIVATLDPRIVFLSPVMAKPYQGIPAVAGLLRILLDSFEDFEYEDELVGPAAYGTFAPDANHVVQGLLFRTRVGGKPVQGLDLVTYGAEGLVTNLTVMVRPISAAMALAKVVMSQMESAAPA